MKSWKRKSWLLKEVPSVYQVCTHKGECLSYTIYFENWFLVVFWFLYNDYDFNVVYLDRLLDTLTHALQTSGVDLSQASISVQIELGKQAKITPNVPISMCVSKVLALISLLN